SGMAKSIDVAGKTEQLPAERALYGDAFTTAGDVMKHALEIMDTPDFESKSSWKFDCQSDGITMHYKDLPDGRYFAGRCKIGISAKDLANEFWNHLNTIHQWNENIKSAKVLHRLTDHVDLTTYCTNDIMIIQSRDFVTARCLREHKNGWHVACRSVQLNEMPEIKSATRGYLHLGVGRSIPDPEDPEHSCIYDYVVCMDLKGMLFKSAVNKVMGRIVCQDIALVRNRGNNDLRKQLYPNL
ncbi:hypothetical protein PENTCL1PPCAC_10512, partial [Pristionchus entomophagus]